MAGNALVEMGTFLAILLGTIAGGVLILVENGALSGGAGHRHAGPDHQLLDAPPPAGLPGRAHQQEPVHAHRGDPAHHQPAARRVPVGAGRLVVLGARRGDSEPPEIFPVYARDTLHASEHVVTLFLSFFCVGIALGSMLTEKISGKNLELGLVPFGSVGMTVFTLDLLIGAPSAVPAELYGVREFLALPGTPRILFDLFAISVFGGFFTVPLYTLMQQRPDPFERSRVIAGTTS